MASRIGIEIREREMARSRRRRRRYEPGQEPWLLREYGGAPVWVICAAAVFLVGVVVLWFVVS